MKYKFKYKTPGELPISKFIKFNEELSKLDNIEAEIYALSILLDISLDEVYTLKTTEAAAYIAQMHKNITKKHDPSSFFNRKPTKLTLNEHKYAINYDVNSLNVAQYVDFQLHLTNSAKDPNDLHNMINILTVFIIPTGHKYGENYDMNTVKADLNNLQMNTALDIYFFLRKRLTSSIKNKLSSIQTILQVTKMMMKDPKVKKELSQTIKDITQMRTTLV